MSRPLPPEKWRCSIHPGERAVMRYRDGKEPWKYYCPLCYRGYLEKRKG